jgi:phenylacetic acid degradation operon negative regulatory protein
VPSADADLIRDTPRDVVRARRPQFLALMLFGVVVFERPLALAASSVIEILGDLDITDHAVRSTLTRMAERGLLARYRRGREVFFGLTEHGSAVLADGHAAAHQSPDRQWDGTWTILGFSLPEEQRALRHQLRSRLVWRGFGLLQSGMWIAPGAIDVNTLIDDLALGPVIRVFTATPTLPTDDGQLIQDAFDLDAIAARYRTFITRWSSRTALAGLDPLTCLLLLQSEWAQIARADPRLPLAHLPHDWPATTAFNLYHRLDQQLRPRAEKTCATRARTAILTPAERDHVAPPGICRYRDAVAAEAPGPRPAG